MRKNPFGNKFLINICFLIISLVLLGIEGFFGYNYFTPAGLIGFPLLLFSLSNILSESKAMSNAVDKMLAPFYIAIAILVLNIQKIIPSLHVKAHLLVAFILFFAGVIHVFNITKKN